MCNGHLPRLARLIRQDPSFNKKISRIHVDEAHNIHTAGLAHHGEDAFRPAYGKLGEFRILLPKGTPFQALSATLPRHILAAVKEQLLMSSDCLEIKLSSNRPNITYATLPLVGSLRNFHNFDVLLPHEFHPPMAIPKTLIFHDCKQDATNAAAYVDARLPHNLQNLGIVKHYHSDMSPEYLQQTFEDFSSPNGTCRILHATAGASTGLDIRGVLIVIQYGLCKNMAEAAQRAGRAVRDQGLHGLYLTMVEPWALELSLVKEDGQISCSDSDPDRPYAGVVKKTSSKPDRTSYASLRFAQSKTCLRKLFAEYLNDQSPEALSYSAQWCCDRHNDGFNILSFFHGDVRTSDAAEVSAAATKRKRTQLRATAERQQLLDALVSWREQAHAQDPYRGVWPIARLLSKNGLELLSKTHPNDTTSPSDLVALLQESDEWGSEYGSKAFAIIQEFDQAKLQVQRSSKSCNTQAETRTVKRAKQATMAMPIMYTFVPVQTPESFVSM
ncbi:P-loop containing nucleoside triphosphate hydrolase protein [Boletus edulis]|nr:P-loop containing nucleoside triphosphate hydrolase protein [Boletus edulis]